MLRVCGKVTKVVLIPLPPSVGRAIEGAVGARSSGPVLFNSRSARMDRRTATRRLRDVQISARHADYHALRLARNNFDLCPNYILAAYIASGT